MFSELSTRGYKLLWSSDEIFPTLRNVFLYYAEKCFSYGFGFSEEYIFSVFFAEPYMLRRAIIVKCAGAKYVDRVTSHINFGWQIKMKTFCDVVRLRFVVRDEFNPEFLGLLKRRLYIDQSIFFFNFAFCSPLLRCRWFVERVDKIHVVLFTCWFFLLLFHVLEMGGRVQA